LWTSPPHPPPSTSHRRTRRHASRLTARRRQPKHSRFRAWRRKRSACVLRWPVHRQRRRCRPRLPLRPLQQPAGRWLRRPLDLHRRDRNQDRSFQVRASPIRVESVHRNRCAWSRVQPLRQRRGLSPAQRSPSRAQ
jgi:hypothetical protein